jgi:hypothetical protein
MGSLKMLLLPDWKDEMDKTRLLVVAIYVYKLRYISGWWEQVSSD